MMPWEHYSQPDIYSAVFAATAVVIVGLLILGGELFVSGFRKR